MKTFTSFRLSCFFDADRCLCLKMSNLAFILSGYVVKYLVELRSLNHSPHIPVLCLSLRAEMLGKSRVKQCFCQKSIPFKRLEFCWTLPPLENYRWNSRENLMQCSLFSACLGFVAHCARSSHNVELSHQGNGRMGCQIPNLHWRAVLCKILGQWAIAWEGRVVNEEESICAIFGDFV